MITYHRVMPIDWHCALLWLRSLEMATGRVATLPCEVDDLVVRFGDVQAVDGISFRVPYGRTLGLLVRGPIVDVLRHMLAGARAGELKQHIEKNSG